MEISDIIKKDSDRVFILDHGCYIIFTGNTLDDSQPFIRIGNWPDLPVDLIPLVENIIITDTLTGNPALEQFNIDINTQSSNRYIGSHFTLKRFLNFQKIFGLDLKNVTIVDVENDIPELQGQTISDRESFIGVFYRDGNFKITHNRGDLFDLHNIMEQPLSTEKIHDRLFENTRSNTSHSGTGFFFSENTVSFYSGGHYFLESFPKHYLTTFDKQQINPKKISAIAHPSANYLGLTSYLSWLNSFSGKVTVLTEDKAQFAIIKKLFSRMSLTYKQLTGSEQSLGNELLIKCVDDTLFDILYKKGEDEKLRLFYAKDSDALNRAVKKAFDCLIVPYTVFENNALLFKSSKTAHVITDDGNQNFKRLSSLTETPIFNSINYDIKKIDSTDKALAYFTELNHAEEIVNLFAADKKEFGEKIEEYFEKEQSIFNRINFLTMVRFFLHITSNRKLSSALTQLLQKFGVQNSAENLVAMKVPFKAELVFAEGAVFPVYHASEKKARSRNFISLTLDEEIPDDGISYKNGDEYNNFKERIAADRERLLLLVALYTNRSNRKKSLSSLKRAIAERKKIYSKSSISKEDIARLKIDKIFHPDQDAAHTSAQKDDSAKKSISPFVNIFWDQEAFDSLSEKSKNENKQHLLLWLALSVRKLPLLLLLCVLLLITTTTLFLTKQGPFKQAVNLADNDSQNTSSPHIKNNEQEVPGSNTDTNVVEQSTPTDKQELEERLEVPGTQETIDKYHIKVTNTDIFHFVNKIAKLNGYAPILTSEINGKNPHWIYPGNIFTLPDKEQIIVRAKDSLWKIAELKLTRMAVEFFQTVDQITLELEKQKSNPEQNYILPESLFAKAESLVFTDKQAQLLNSLHAQFKSQ